MIAAIKKTYYYYARHNNIEIMYCSYIEETYKCIEREVLSSVGEGREVYTVARRRRRRKTKKKYGW